MQTIYITVRNVNCLQCLLKDYALRLMQFKSSKAVSRRLTKVSCPLRNHTLGS
jgi:hypothetical protein